MKKTTIIALAVSAIAVIAVLAFGTQPRRVAERCLFDDLVYELAGGEIGIEENSPACVTPPSQEGLDINVVDDRPPVSVDVGQMNLDTLHAGDAMPMTPDE